MQNYFITVIIPVYNAEQYIERAVKSLLDQTTKEIEIILVDDGSKDASGKICVFIYFLFNSLFFGFLWKFSVFSPVSDIYRHPKSKISASFVLIYL